MNSKRETGMAWLAATMLIIACILMAMCSCSTKKVITETIWEHDTVTVHHSDTIKEVVYKSKVDTVTNTEVHTYTLNNVGDTVREIHHYHNKEKVIVVDSTDRYKSIVDSLQAIVNKQHEKHEKVTKTKRPWTDYIIVAAVLAFALFLIKKIP